MVAKTPFKKYIKRYLGDYTEKNGFQIQGRLLYRIKNRILQGIYFDSSGFSKQTVPTLFIQPLFIPNEGIEFSLGARWGRFEGKGEGWLPLETEEQVEDAFRQIKPFLETIALDWFSLLNSSEEIISNYEKNPNLKGFGTLGKGKWVIPYNLGFIACDAGKIVLAKNYLGNAEQILRNIEWDWADERISELEELTANFENPTKIRGVLDRNVKKTAEALKIRIN